jgi:hypothetical protein
MNVLAFQMYNKLPCERQKQASIDHFDSISSEGNPKILFIYYHKEYLGLRNCICCPGHFCWDGYQAKFIYNQ